MSTLLNSLTYQVKPDAVCVRIYAQSINQRLSYTCRFIFNQVLKVNFELITNETEFISEPGFKINFSNQDFENTYKIIPHTFINEHSVNADVFYLSEKNNHWYLYQTQIQETNQAPLDFFSTVFYFISRYEEWQNYQPDQHLRFEANSSILFKNNLHLKPLVDIWIDDFKNAFEKFYQKKIFPEKQFKVISTIDVDNVYAFKTKGFIRSTGAYVRDFIKLDLKNIINRTQVLFFSKKDPFDVYEELNLFCLEQNIPLIYFFLMRTGTKHDRSLNPESNAFKLVFETIKKQNAHIGIHPSYDTAYENNLLQNELNIIQNQANQKVIFSRQHFLRFNIKTTPQLLMSKGIQADFTMGFASTPGFRAGTSFPFYYYDFANETTGSLLMVPFCLMDGAYTVYSKLNANDAFENIKSISSEIQKVGGYFISVFHERSFYDHLYKDFGALYKKIHLNLK